MKKEKILDIVKAIEEREKINRDIQLDLLLQDENDDYRKGQYLYSLGKYDMICELLEKLGEKNEKEKN